MVVCRRGWRRSVIAAGGVDGFSRKAPFVPGGEDLSKAHCRVWRRLFGVISQTNKGKVQICEAAIRLLPCKS